jgi:hypothetical protein
MTLAATPIAFRVAAGAGSSFLPVNSEQRGRWPEWRNETWRSDRALTSCPPRDPSQTVGPAREARAGQAFLLGLVGCCANHTID